MTLNHCFDMAMTSFAVSLSSVRLPKFLDFVYSYKIHRPKGPFLRTNIKHGHIKHGTFCIAKNFYGIYVSFFGLAERRASTKSSLLDTV